MSAQTPFAGTGILTVDVEDWYHPLVKDPQRWGDFEDRISGPVGTLLELLRPSGSRATFFVLGAIAERHPELVRRIAAAGHEVGCHGHHHLPLARLGPDGFTRDLERSLGALEGAGISRVVSYRAPYFSLDHRTGWALEILADHGFRVDSSMFPLWTGYYGSARAGNAPRRLGRIWEYPVTLPTFAGVRVPLSGGFYSRFFPAAWTLAGIRRVAAHGLEPHLYLHPWELDTGQPRIRVGRLLTWRHYLRLDRTRAVFEAALRSGRWRSLRESLAAREEGARRAG